MSRAQAANASVSATIRICMPSFPLPCVPLCACVTAFVANLSEALGAPPVPFGDVVQGGNQTEDVIAVVTAVAQQESVLCGSTATHQAHVLIHLMVERENQSFAASSVTLHFYHGHASFNNLKKQKQKTTHFAGGSFDQLI